MKAPQQSVLAQARAVLLTEPHLPTMIRNKEMKERQKVSK